MVIGSGLLANIFSEYYNDDNVLFFASGVSNSKETIKSEFNRESMLLSDSIHAYPDKTFIYFSTCSVYDDSVNKSPYVQHKLKIEQVVKEKCSRYYIFRLPQVVGYANNNTLINYIMRSLVNNERMYVNKYSTRNLIGADDVFLIVSHILNGCHFINETVNVATPYNTTVVEIINILERITCMSLTYDVINVGQRVIINIDKLKSLNADFDIFDSDYLENLLQKFCHGYGLPNR